jgi:hypothetical protein
MSSAVPSYQPLPLWLRILLVLIPLGLGSLLIVASQLSPDRRGFGTHQQLGFPECSFILLWDIPCPMCGMTTSWSHLMHGQIMQSFEANQGGALLGLTSMLAIPVCLWRAWLGTATRKNWLSSATLLWLCIVISVIAMQWFWRL